MSGGFYRFSEWRPGRKAASLYKGGKINLNQIRIYAQSYTRARVCPYNTGGVLGVRHPSPFKRPGKISPELIAAVHHEGAEGLPPLMVVPRPRICFRFADVRERRAFRRLAVRFVRSVPGGRYGEKREVFRISRDANTTVAGIGSNSGRSILSTVFQNETIRSIQHHNDIVEILGNSDNSSAALQGPREFPISR